MSHKQNDTWNEQQKELKENMLDNILSKLISLEYNYYPGDFTKEKEYQNIVEEIKNLLTTRS